MSYKAYGTKFTTDRETLVVVLDRNSGQVLKTKTVSAGEDSLYLTNQEQNAVLLGIPTSGENIQASIIDNVLLKSNTEFASGIWYKSITSLPYTPREHMINGAYNNRIYVGGGSGGGTDFWEYNIITETWTQRASMPENKYGGINGTYNGKLYSLGGYNASSAWSSKFLVYDIASDEWDYLADRSTATHATGTLYNGILYVGTGQWTRAFYKYDIDTNTWTQLADTLARGYGLCFCGDGNYLYNTGGVNGTSGSYNNFLGRYDIAGNTWSSLASPGTHRYRSFVGHGGNLYLQGDSILKKYSVSENSWSTLTTPMQNMAAINDFGVLDDGVIYYIDNYSRIDAYKI